MEIQAELIRELHRLLIQKTDLESTLARGPKLLSANQQQLKSAEEFREVAKQKLQKARMAYDEKQLHLKSRESRVEDLNTKLNLSDNNKEYQAIKEQIAADEQANGALSDEIFELLEKMDEIEGEIKEADDHVAKAAAKLKLAEDHLAEKQEGLQNELNRILANLETAEGKLPADFKMDYRRLVEGRGEEALAPVVDGQSCGTCYQTLSPQTFNLLYMAKPIFCSSCGSLLYLKEDRKVT